MFCEIEFLPVGTGSKPGDAIIVRYGDDANYEFMVVDGGTAETGELIVSHLDKHFGANVVIAHMVLTHSDSDHASGLREVLKKIPVKNLWLHIPWFHAEETLSLFEYKQWTKDGLAAAIKKEYDIVSEIVDLAVAQQCAVMAPFQGVAIGPFRVLSPSQYAYNYLIPQFDKTPNADQKAIEAAQMWIGKQPSAFFKALEKVVAKAQTWVDETWENERLKDGGITSASNESSIVLYGDFGDGRRILLTGDAGIKALTWSVNYANSAGLMLQNFSFVQIPHHGSRRNVGPTVLNQLLGPIQPQGSPTRYAAFVSAPPDDDTHPRKMVINAFLRRGAMVIATQGRSKVHWGGFAKRPGYTDAEEISFSPKVEEYD
jgi:beta-lactamase superfamily II metal-dependent hydrolase